VIGVVEIIENSELRDKIHVFEDRSHAGEMLGILLREYEDRKDCIILAIPAGGVPVAVQVSKKLNIQWDLAVTRKLHIPWNREAGFGAISWDGNIILNKALVSSLGLTSEEVDACVEEEKRVIQNRLRQFSGSIPFPELNDKVVIVVDDGLASGFSMLITVKTLRVKAKEVVVAVPTAPVKSIKLISAYVDRVVCLNIRSGSSFAVADAYKVWYDLTDKDVMEILKRKNN
jgi:predicted phosphoribosyltransferase